MVLCENYAEMRCVCGFSVLRVGITNKRGGNAVKQTHTPSMGLFAVVVGIAGASESFDASTTRSILAPSIDRGMALMSGRSCVGVGAAEK